MNHSLPAGTRRRIVVQPHFRDVEYDPFARCVRQDEAGREYDRGSLAWCPAVYPQVGVDDFVIAEVVIARNIEQRFLLAGVNHLDFSDNIRIGRR